MFIEKHHSLPPNCEPYALRTKFTFAFDYRSAVVKFGELDYARVAFKMLRLLFFLIVYMVDKNKIIALKQKYLKY